MLEKAKSETAAFEEKLKAIQEKIESAEATKAESKKKLERQEKENEELARKIEKLQEVKANEEEVKNTKELEEQDRINKQIERLKAELKKAESTKSPLKLKSKKSEADLEVLFKERSGHLANLQKCLAQAQLTLEKLRKEQTEGSPENTPTASPQKKNPARPLRRRATERAEIEKATKENKEWKDRCNAMAQQLFEAKVAWADENNGYQKGTNDLSQVYTYAVTRLEELRQDYTNVKSEYDKLNKKRTKCLAKKK